MDRILIERASTSVTVQAFAIVVRSVQFDVCWLWRIPKILNKDVLEPSEFGTQAAVQAVVGMAGVARLIGWHSMILKMCGRDIRRVVHIETSSISFHDVAGDAEFRLLRALDMSRGSHRATEHRQYAKGCKSQNLPRRRSGHCGSHNDSGDQNRCDRQQSVQ